MTARPSRVSIPIVVGAIAPTVCPLSAAAPSAPLHFVPNTFRFWDAPRFATTENPPKPAYADVIVEPSNFLPCQGGPFALCNSGPSGAPASEDLSCTLTEDGRFATCRCDAYACAPSGSIEPGYTCDATLCTDQCNDQDLVAEACGDLPRCPKAGTAAILELETAAGCSCCASQLCGCELNAQTNAAIATLVEQQRARGITPQCDVNGTLCGAAVSPADATTR